MLMVADTINLDKCIIIKGTVRQNSIIYVYHGVPVSASLALGTSSIISGIFSVLPYAFRGPLKGQ